MKITYGSIIAISHFQDENALVASDGFMKNSVSLTGMNLHPVKHNIQNCLFMVCPRMICTQSNDAQSRLPQTKQDQDDQKTHVSPTQTMISKQSQKESHEKTIRNLQTQIYNEFKDNTLSFEKEIGRAVIYDEIVQFMHVCSGKWLCCLQDFAKFENQNQKVILTDYPSELTFFKIMPQFKFQLEGDQIIYENEIVRIISYTKKDTNKPCYLHCSGEKLKMNRNYSEKLDSNIIRKREINGSLEEPTPWQINLYNHQQNTIGCGDLVWIHHSESCATLTVNQGEIAVNHVNLAELSFDSYSANAYSMWVIEDAKRYKQGGPFKYRNQYRIRHFSSGLFLAIAKIKPVETTSVIQDPYAKKKIIIPPINKVPAVYTLKDIPDEECLFEFLPLKPTDQIHIGQSFIKIQAVHHKKLLDFVDKHDGDQVEKPILLNKDSDNKKSEHAVFKIFKANEVESLEVFFLDSCTKQLKKYISSESIDYQQKLKQFKQCRYCVVSLTDFLRQKTTNSNLTQKFDVISLKRQRLMLQQQFLDLLIQMLLFVDKSELEIWQNRAKYKSEQPPQTINSSKRHVQVINKAQQIELSIIKVDLSTYIFELLRTACQNNEQNQFYLYDRLPEYQYYCKYMGAAVDFLISIVKDNQKLLLNISSNLRIEFDYQKNEEIQEEMAKKVKILINFYEKDAPLDHKIVPKTHDRIIAKPINIINYFFNLLWDDASLNKSDYLRFLRHICRYQQKGLSQNQENLFKLYKKFNQKQKMFITNFDQEIASQDFDFVTEQLNFYAEVSFNRNLIWQKELAPLFKVDNLFKQVWTEQKGPMNALWCKLGNSLYLDQQPHNRVNYPNFCRLYSECEQLIHSSHEKLPFDRGTLMTYIGKIFRLIQSKIERPDRSEKTQENVIDDLLFTTSQLIITCLDLNLFPLSDYPQLIHALLVMFIYDRKNINYISAALKSYESKIQKRIQKIQDDTLKKLDILNLGAGVEFLSGIVANKKDEEKSEDIEENDEQIYDEPKIFKNPIMRGYMSLSYKLEQTMNLPNSALEIQFKLQICQMIEYFLDKRQDYLITNILVWFKQYEYTKEDCANGDSISSLIEMMFKNNIEYLLPNIAKTGIDLIDDPPVQETKLISIDKEKPRFTNFLKEQSADDITQDLDTYLSYAFEEKKNVVASVFPYLLTSYFQVQDNVLEERCLNIMMRLFNQRQELKYNIEKLQVLFDNEKSDIFKYIQGNMLEFKEIIESSEVWLSEFKLGFNQKMRSCTQFLYDFTKIMYISTSISEEKQNKIDGDIEGARIDTKRQSIMSFLKVHEYVISLACNGLYHMIEVLKSLKYTFDQKSIIFELFQTAYQFLIIFCKENRANQQLLSQHIEIFLTNMEYDVGQCELLVEIHRDNIKLLQKQRIHKKIFNIIESEGRQVKFLHILKTLLSNEDKYLLENQSLILNTLIPDNDNKLRTLYAEGSNIKELRFYLDDQYAEPEKNMLHQLKSVDWTDTYRDEPFLYQAEMIDLMLSCSMLTKYSYSPEEDQDDKDNYNINVFKVKKIIRVQYTLEILKMPDGMVNAAYRPLDFTKLLSVNVGQKAENHDQREGLIHLKPKLADLIRMVYIQSEKQESQLIAYQLEFVLFLEGEIKKMEYILSDAPHFGYGIYVIRHILPIIICYHRRVLTSNNIEVKNLFQNFSKVFVKCFNLSFKNEVTTKVDAQIVFTFWRYYNSHSVELDDKELKELLKINDEIVNLEVQVIEQPEVKEEQSRHKSIMNISFQSLNFSSILGQKDTRPNRKILNASQSEQQWMQFVEQFNLPKMKEQIELEQQALAGAIVNAEQLISEKCEGAPTKEAILKKLINFLQVGILDPKNKETIIILLRIMRKIMDNTDKNLTDEEKEELSQKEKDELNEIHKKNQNMFDNLGATLMVLNILTDYSKMLSSDLLYNLLLFINTLLDDGNTQVQKTIYNFCITQQKSEVLFHAFAGYLKVQQLEDAEESNKQKLIVDEVLKFLQNCTEGHYGDLQNYIRFQSNSRATIDMINLIADLFKTYPRVKDSFLNMMRCLDTLNELVQGPCKENQVAVADSKFFDVVQELIPFKKIVKVDQQGTMRSAHSKAKTEYTDSKNIPLSPGMIAQLQNKVLVLVLSLLESREMKDPILKRIMRSLPIQVLEKMISKVYKHWHNEFNGEYVMEAFANIGFDEDQKGSEIIIQNGLYIMFLICYYFETGDELDSPMVKYNRLYLKSQNKENGLFDPNTTLGQLFALMQDLIEKYLFLQKNLIQRAQAMRGGQQSAEELTLLNQKEKQEEKRRRLRRAFNFFRSKTAHIEVIRDEQIELVFFPILPYCRLEKEEKEQFQLNVDRASVKSKVQDLLQKSEEFIVIMKHEEYMKRFYIQYPIIGFFANYIQLWKSLAFYLTVALNIIILGSFSHKDGDGNQLSDYELMRKQSNSYTQSVIFVLGLVMTVCSLFVVVFVLAKIAPIIIKKALKRKQIFDGAGLLSYLFNKLFQILFVLFYCLADIQVVYYLAYGVLSVLGIVIHPFFFVFHLSVILIRYPTLSNVVRSVTQPWDALVLTLLLIIILTYIYTLVAFYSLQDDFFPICTSVLDCFYQIFDMNFNVPGGIGGQLTNVNPSYNYTFGLFIFEETNTLILVIILISIAFGIIIDTFGQLREQENLMNDDIKKKCFICGLDNVVFERSSDKSAGFQGHIRVDHYMWNYLYYIAYLEWKSEQDYSGVESYVKNKYRAQDLSWIPFNKARELQAMNDQEAKDIKDCEAMVQTLESYVQTMSQITKDIHAKKNNKKINTAQSVVMIQ